MERALHFTNEKWRAGWLAGWINLARPHLEIIPLPLIPLPNIPRPPSPRLKKPGDYSVLLGFARLGPVLVEAGDHERINTCGRRRPARCRMVFGRSDRPWPASSYSWR